MNCLENAHRAGVLFAIVIGMAASAMVLAVRGPYSVDPVGYMYPLMLLVSAFLAMRTAHRESHVAR